MNNCDFKKLVRLVGNQLKLDSKLEVLIHLDNCSVCRDAVYQIARNLDKDLYIKRRIKPSKHKVA